MLRFFRKFACFSSPQNVSEGPANGGDSEEVVENSPTSAPAPVPVLTRTISSNIDIPIPPEPSNWWLSHHVPTRPSARMNPNRLLTTDLFHHINESRQKTYEMVPISRHTTVDVRSDDSSITQVSTDSQTVSEQQGEVSQLQNSKHSPAIHACNEQTVVPRATLVKIGIIVRSRNGSIPRVIPLNPQQNAESSEALVKAALFYEELGRQGDSMCETHIFYNTQSGKVELNGGYFEQEYII